MDIHDINRDPDLKDTPFGDLSISEQDGTYLVSRAHPLTGDETVLLLVNLDEGRTVWSAGGGSRNWEALHVRAISKLQQLRRREEGERAKADLRFTFRRELKEQLARRVDGKEDLMRALCGVR